MRQRVTIMVAIFAALLGASNRASALPYEPGEHLKLSVSYMHMGVGDVDLSVGQGTQSGVRVWPLELRARTYGFFNTLHSVDDRYVANIDPVTQRLVSTEADQKVKRGRATESMRVEGGSAVIHRASPEGNRDHTENFQPGSYDILSAIYFLRGQDFQTADVHVPIFNGSKTWELIAHQAGQETIKTDAGQFNTIVVKCRTQFGGDPSKGREMTVWFSNDQHRLPVKIEAALSVGTMRAELKSVAGGSLAQW
jgi:hypothetical protein